MRDELTREDAGPAAAGKKHESSGAPARWPPRTSVKRTHELCPMWAGVLRRPTAGPAVFLCYSGVFPDAQT